MLLVIILGIWDGSSFLCRWKINNQYGAGYAEWSLWQAAGVFPSCEYEWLLLFASDAITSDALCSSCSLLSKRPSRWSLIRLSDAVVHPHDFLLTSPSMAWFSGDFSAFFGNRIRYVAVKTSPVWKQQKTLDKINQYARENLDCLRVIRALPVRNFRKSAFNEMKSMRRIPTVSLSWPVWREPLCADYHCYDCITVWFALKPLGSGELIRI